VAPLARFVIAEGPQSTHGLGNPRFTLLKTFATSTRNCSEELSVREIFLRTARSVLKKPGARRELRPAVPKVPGAGRRQGPKVPPGAAVRVPVLFVTVPAASGLGSS
jgi:hypothetical protein